MIKINLLFMILEIIIYNINKKSIELMIINLIMRILLLNINHGILMH